MLIKDLNKKTNKLIIKIKKEKCKHSIRSDEAGFDSEHDDGNDNEYPLEP